ncbi:hypothetical protein L3X38_034329 [Prunus dulcis]|uniref:Uncharacterized protein n=1 Tax=Prunus dulcis TaxID=3755 RepID=A0AAD4YXT1_PRUDU|nr:hypothetical protein L3X38_034329 [Prunus dulcis]
MNNYQSIFGAHHHSVSVFSNLVWLLGTTFLLLMFKAIQVKALLCVSPWILRKPELNSGLYSRSFEGKKLL